MMVVSQLANLRSEEIVQFSGELLVLRWSRDVMRVGFPSLDLELFKLF